jgi:glycosyltransferase involved in cell wall biosynthesis
MKLSVAIIAKNEEALISKCLESVKDADEVVFVDTGSTDCTAILAEKYTNGIYWIKWDDDFSKVYNFACSLCEGDWILSIDADEQLEDDGILKIRQQLDLYAPGIMAYRMHLEYPDKTSMGIKLLRNRAGIHWIGKAHKDLNVSAIAETPLSVRIYCTNSPAHKNDPDRTFRILKQDFYDSPANTRNLYYLAREYVNRHQFENALDLFKRYFKDGHDRFLRADACLYLAKVYRVSDMRLARAWADKATHVLPEFKEAWDFCAFIAQDKFKRFAYLKFYDRANNRGVRTIRKFRWSDIDRQT